MPFTRVQRRFTAWLAMLALVLAALLPTLAQAAVAGSDRSDWMQICSASGMVWIQAEPDAAGTDSAPMVDMEMHCPWCTLHNPVAGLPPASVLNFTAAASTPLLGPVKVAAPPVGVWTAAPARAPPLNS